VHTLPPNPAFRPLTDVQFARLKNQQHDVPLSPADCVTCQGEKHFRWYAQGSRSEVVDYECPCDQQWLLHLWLLYAGIGINYQRLGWDDASNVPPAAKAAVHGYAQQAKARARIGLGLTLLGEMRGTGKSLLAHLLLKQLLAEGFEGYFVTFQGMLDLYTDGWSSREDKAWFSARVANTGVLVIDDIGRDSKGRIEMAGPMVDHILRTRYERARPTIITTNKSLDELGQLYSLNALSLMAGRCKTVEFLGSDYRDADFERLDAELEAGITRPVMV
jgi:DNA replication protein DnaC